MKILYVCADRGIPLDGSKGASIHVRQTVSGLLDRGHDVQVLSARPPARGGYDCDVIGPAADGSLLAGRAAGGPGTESDEPFETELRGLALSYQLAAQPALPAAVDAVYERYSLWSLTGLFLARRYRVPLVLEINAPLIEEQRRYRRLCLEGLAGEIEQKLVREAAAILCVSSPLQRRAAQLRGTASGVHLFPNAVDTDRFRPPVAPEADGSAPEGRLDIVFVGSLKPWHGLPTLIQAFAILAAQNPAARLWIVGSGPERSNLQRQATTLGLSDRIRFTGALPHERIPTLLGAVDIAVAPYPALDQFYFSPLKLTEYLAAGLPVIATQLGDLDAVLGTEESILEVPPDDPAALAGALIRLAHDRQLRQRLGAAGRRVAERHLSLAGALDRLERLLEQLVHSPAPANQAEAACESAMC
ncbi:MAG TPA: glycosyltransferase family 4 protein [Acidobacteriota bacterium]